MGRRSELLRWAYEAPGRYLIEDDYDSEFRYASRPIPAMQGLDEGGRVIYVGTFSRTLAPSIRVAYLILPPELLKRYRDKFGHGAATVSRFEQEALRRFLASGSYSRHLRRVGNLYRQRRDALVAALSGWGEVRGSDAGLHLLFTLPGRREEELKRRAAEAGYRVRGLGEYCQRAVPRPGTLVLGFAGLDVSVREYEPLTALRGGEDGLDFYRAIAAKWKSALRLGGALLFEVGIGQAPRWRTSWPRTAMRTSRPPRIPRVSGVWWKERSTIKCLLAW